VDRASINTAREDYILEGILGLVNGAPTSFCLARKLGDIASYVDDLLVIA
jgi:hypothetical protein